MKESDCPDTVVPPDDVGIFEICIVDRGEGGSQT